MEQTTTIRLTFRVVVTHIQRLHALGFKAESFSKAEISPCGF